LFRNRINDYADKLITDEMLIPEIQIDFEAKGVDINLTTAKQITYMKPFGVGNPMPVFCFRGAILLGKKTIGDGKHLKLTFDIEGQNIEGIYFGKGYLERGLFIGDKTDIVFTQEINDFRGIQSLQIKLLDIRLTETVIKRNQLLYKVALGVECLDCDKKWLYNRIIDETINFDDVVVNRDILAVIYKYVRRRISDSLSVPDMFVHARILAKETKSNINFFKFFVSLLVFDELGLLELSLEADGSYRVNLIDEATKVDLKDSEILDWVHETAASME
jgi:single-stranded-DNA-specific exonuclease